MNVKAVEKNLLNSGSKFTWRKVTCQNKSYTWMKFLCSINVWLKEFHPPGVKSMSGFQARGQGCRLQFKTLCENLKTFGLCSKHSLPREYKSNKSRGLVPLKMPHLPPNDYVSKMENYCLENNIAFKVLPTADNIPTHPLFIAYLPSNSKVGFLPSNIPSFIEPMEQKVSTAVAATGENVEKTPSSSRRVTTSMTAPKT